MSAPSPRVTLTPEVHEYFTRYLRGKNHSAWGIYHVWLDDGNYDIPATGEPNDCNGFYEITDEDRRMWEFFKLTSPSQKRRIGRRATHGAPPSTVIGSAIVVIGADPFHGVITLSSGKPR